MAIDSAAKRYSAMNPMSPWRHLATVPSGTIAIEDRAAVLFLYGGLATEGGGGSWTAFVSLSGTAVDEDGVMGTIFLNDATAVPGTAWFVNGLAHHQDGRRYVALWPGSGTPQYIGPVAVRTDGAMLIDPSGTPTQNFAATALTYRGEVVASTSAPQVWPFGFGHRSTGAMCMSEVA